LIQYCTRHSAHGMRRAPVPVGVGGFAPPCQLMRGHARRPLPTTLLFIVTRLASRQTVVGGTIQTTFPIKDSSFDPFCSGSVSPTARGRVHVAWGHDRCGPLCPAQSRERVGADCERRFVVCENNFPCHTHVVSHTDFWNWHTSRFAPTLHDGRTPRTRCALVDGRPRARLHFVRDPVRMAYLAPRCATGGGT